jgi:NAD(P)-dependent dehydrogenase (short-subunit alcohol dehydrogenase family)
MDLQRKDKVVVITGRTKHIGRSITRACQEKGAIPAVIDRDQQASDAPKTGLVQAGKAGAFINAELSKAEECQRRGCRGPGAVRQDRCAGEQRRRKRQSCTRERQSKRSNAISSTTTTWRTTRCPTGLSTFHNPEETLAAITAKIPSGKRMTQADEIGWTAIFMLSPRSGQTTAQQLFIDGGYVHLDRAIS